MKKDGIGGGHTKTGLIYEGKVELYTLDDGWTVKTLDGKLSCHYENTIAVTKNGYEILTLEKGEQN